MHNAICFIALLAAFIFAINKPINHYGSDRFQAPLEDRIGIEPINTIRD